MRRALVIAGIVLAASFARAQAGETRAAVIVGDNDGGSGAVRLRYAVTDAERIDRILTTLGGVLPANAFLLRHPTVAQLEQALTDADRRAHGGVVFFYFSGHSRDGALRLGEEALPLPELRRRLSALHARVKVAILDSCNSGELIRSKGGTVGPPFRVSIEAPGPEGLAVLASSAAGEDSQESDLLGASFFTYYLASGLRGDADTNQDGKVTLSEAYDYAYARTVAETAEARAGLQHPTYGYTLSGTGDVWLTDVSNATAALILPPDSSGDYVIVDARKRTLVAEVDKAKGTRRTVALPPSTYEVKRRDGDHALFARVRLSKGDQVTLFDGAMERIALARNLVKGPDWAGDLARVRPWRLSVSAGAARQFFFAAATRSDYFPDLTLGEIDVELRDLFSSAAPVLGIDFAAGTAPLTLKLGETAIVSQVTQWMGGVSFLEELPAGRFKPYLGVRLSVIDVERGFSPTSSGQSFPSQSLLTSAPGVVAGVNVRLVGRLALGVRARASFLLYRSQDQDLSLGYADVGLVLKWEL